jgi:hypothetical protein
MLAAAGRQCQWYFAESPRFSSKTPSAFHPHAQRNVFRCDAVIRVYDAAGNVIETHEHANFLKARSFLFLTKLQHLCS